MIVTTIAVSHKANAELTPRQISDILDQGVAATVAYARTHSPFYRRKFASTGVIAGIDDLRRLPLTTKTDVSQFNDQFWCGSRDRFIDICTTSGTTGVPTLCPLTQPDLERLGQNEYHCFRQVGLSPGDRVILAVTIDKCFMAGLAYFEGLRRLGVTTVRVGAGSPSMLLSMMDRLKPTAIVSVPSFLKRVATYAAQQGIDPAQSTVRKLVCIGEPVRESDFRLTPLGSQIAQAWDAQVYSTYGATELACSLCECDAGMGGHMLPQFLHIEILDDNGKPVLDGQEGELVATTIGVTGMPLVRFATGDMTFMTREPCACGRYTPRIGPILGRRDQRMKIKGTTVYPAAVQRALQKIDLITDYLMIATAPTSLSDELEVVVSMREEPAGILDAIREVLRGELKVCPAVRIVAHCELQELAHSSELRKQRVVLDRRGRSQST